MPHSDKGLDEQIDRDSIPLRTKLDSRGGGLVVTKKRSRVRFLGILPALLLVLLSAGPATFILLWLTVIRGPASPAGLRDSIRQHGVFLVDEGTKTTKDGTERSRLVVLSISTATTQILSLLRPMFIGLSAFITAGAWLRAQELQRPNGLPTPLQYGILVKLLSVAGFRGLRDGGRYVFTNKHPTAKPPLLRAAFFLAAWIWIVTQLIGVGDMWLHATSSTDMQNSTRPVAITDDRNLVGVAFSEELCGEERNVRGCLVQDLGWAASDPVVQMAGLLISSNTSAGVFGEGTGQPLAVITLRDAENLAVVVPARHQRDLDWVAPSFGIRSKCKNLTPQCIASRNPIQLNCSSAGHPYLPFTGSTNTGAASLLPGRVLSLLNNTLIGTRSGVRDIPPGTFPNNPQTVALEFQWPIPGEDPSRFVPPNSFVNVSSDGIATGFAECELSFFNVTVQHEGGKYKLAKEPERTSQTFSATMWGPLISQMANTQLHANLQARALSGQDDYIVGNLNQELSRLALGIFAGSLKNAKPTQLSQTTKSLLSRYSVWPVAAYTLLLYAYALTAFYVFVRTISFLTYVVTAPDGSTATSLELTQWQLVDPVTIVASAFPSMIHLPKRIDKDPILTFMEDRHTARLVVDCDHGPNSDLRFRAREKERDTGDADSLLGG